MGLDIMAFSQLTPVEDPSKGDDLDQYFQVRVNSDFPERADDLPHGMVYEYGHATSFRAGSYSGYGVWRRHLAKLVGIDNIEDAWSNPQPGPFIELINFSDCEGTIGPKTSAKLAQDFKDWDERAAEYGGQVPWFYDLYRTWRQAFEMAAHNGAVDFG